MHLVVVLVTRMAACSLTFCCLHQISLSTSMSLVWACLLTVSFDVGNYVIILSSTAQQLGLRLTQTSWEHDRAWSHLGVVNTDRLTAVGAISAGDDDTARTELAAVQVGAAAGGVRQSVAGHTSSVCDVERQVLQQRTSTIVPQLQSVRLHPRRRQNQVSLQ